MKSASYHVTQRPAEKTRQTQRHTLSSQPGSMRDRIRSKLSVPPVTVIIVTDTRPDAVSEEQYRKLVDLAVERITDAERCADAGCFTAACAMAGAGVEAALMAHVCCSVAEVRAANRWHDSKAAPLDWSLERLIQIAVALEWLPASRASIPEDEGGDALARQGQEVTEGCGHGPAARS